MVQQTEHHRAAHRSSTSTGRRTGDGAGLQCGDQRILVDTFNQYRGLALVLSNFNLDFVNDLAEIAEEAQHYPDITIRHTKVTLKLTTHDAGGVTDADTGGLGEGVDGYVVDRPMRWPAQAGSDPAASDPAFALHCTKHESNKR